MSLAVSALAGGFFITEPPPAAAAAAAAASFQWCPTLCNPIDGSPRGSPVPGILQARTLEWLPFSMCNYFLLNGNVGFYSLLSPEAKREFADQS